MLWIPQHLETQPGYLDTRSTLRSLGQAVETQQVAQKHST
uniref:Uncharacterized protein n=1 Tax=Pseudomonas syringae TaxID=317 RepID=I3W0D6_PSESX|nr:hypothetical protein [Pseudomonas syringae]